MTTVIGSCRLILLASSSGICERLEDVGNVLLVLFWVPKCVRDIEAKLDAGGKHFLDMQEIQNFGEKPELRDRERPELHLKTNDALERGLDDTGDGSSTLIGFGDGRNAAQNPK